MYCRFGKGEEGGDFMFGILMWVGWHQSGHLEETPSGTTIIEAMRESRVGLDRWGVVRDEHRPNRVAYALLECRKHVTSM
jgi:hypothetical protein